MDIKKYKKHKIKSIIFNGIIIFLITLGWYLLSYKATIIYNSYELKLNTINQDTQKQNQFLTENEFLIFLIQTISYAKNLDKNKPSSKNIKQLYIDASGSNTILDSGIAFKHYTVYGIKDSNQILNHKSNLKNFITYKENILQILATINYSYVKNIYIKELFLHLKYAKSFSEIKTLEESANIAINYFNKDLIRFQNYLEFKSVANLTILIVYITLLFLIILNLFSNLNIAIFEEDVRIDRGELGVISESSKLNPTINFYTTLSGFINGSNHLTESKNVLIKKEVFQINYLLNTLGIFSTNHRNFGITLTFILISLIIMFGYFVNFKFIPDQAKIITELTSQNKNSFSLVTYYLGRVLLFGSFSSAVLYFIYRVIKSSFDQSVRYRKKQHGLIIFQNLINRYPEATLEQLKEIVNVYDHITKSVDSAFTESELKKSKDQTNPSVKFKNGDTEFSTNTV